MAMRKKDYEAIARLLNDQRESNPALIRTREDAVCANTINAVLEITARQLADHSAAQSQSFDRARFLKACGVSE